MRGKHRRYTLVSFVIALIFFLMSAALPKLSQTAPSAHAAVQRAWQRAQQAGVYHFTTELAQTTYPAPMVRNAGRETQVETLYMEGSVNTPAHQMELLLRPQGGSALSLRDSFEVRIDGDEAYGRSPGGEWQALHGFSDAFAPAGDLLAYLAGARNVREVEEGRYRYDLDGPAFAAYVRDQLERYLIQQGELPPSLSLQSADLYHDVQGEGEVWLTDAGLPARLAVALAYPPAPDGERVTAQVTTDFFGFPEPTGGVLQRYVAPALTRSPSAWQDLAQQLSLALGTVSFLSLLVLRRGSRALYAVVVLILIVSMVAAPVVESVKAADFLDRQAEKRSQWETEKAAQDEADRAQAALTTTDWDPNQAPMERPASERDAAVAGDVIASPAQAAGETNEASIMDLCTDDERTTDTDEDGLTDCDERTRYLTDVHRADTDGDTLLDGWEVLRLGTLPIADLGADSDGDGIGDGLEVVGFTYRGQSWYSDPNTPDSDGDGRHDGLECPQRLDAGGETSIDPATPCVDTDDDGVPDLFDLDSDDDGVPDKLDLSPLTVRGQATPFGRTAPFQLLVNNLQSRPDGEGGYFPTLLDLQIRPVNPEHLTYALNVLDWPSGDELGQIQRRRGNDSTFADAMSPAQGAADPRAANGDVRLIPMLEIEMSGANLPFPMTTARTTLRWQNTFDIALRFTQQEGLIEAHLVEPATGEQSYGFQIYEGVCGDLGDPTGLRFTLSSDQSVGTLIGLGSLLDIADGEHVIVADNDAAQQDLVRACVPINDLPNGDADTQMIDTEPLRAYGMSVRDKDHQGTVLVYAPLNVVPDETGGGRTAFSARILYQPQAANLGDVAQQMRVVWMVQALSDWCKPMPADISDEDAEDWCDSAENWSLDNPQLVHTYYEDWYLTGLSVREDHGLNVAVAWEDPATRSPDALRYEDWLWILANDLATVFLAGRDQDDNGVRDLGVATETAGFLLADSTLEQRFDAPLDPTITAVDRFGIPLTVTFGVETFAYPNQDHVAHVMMSESERILQENFGAYPEATPTLLFAREEMYRLTSLSDGASEDGPVVSLDFAERDVKVLSALNWAPYRYRENTWRAYPIDEYWQQMEVLLTGLFTYNPAYPEETMRDIRTGEIMLARAYYLSLNQGHVSLVQVNDTPVNRQETEQTDASLAASLAETVALKGARSAALIKIITEELADALASALTKLANFSVEWDLNKISYSGRFGITKRDILLKTLGRSIYNTVNDGSPSALTKLLDKVKAKLGKLHNKLYGESPSLARKVGVSTSLVIGAIAIVATLLTLLPIGFFFADTALMLQVCINAAVATVMIVLLIKTLDDVNDIFKAFKAAGTVTAQSVGRIAYITAVVSKEVQNMSKVTLVCAVIGLIIGVAVAFGGLMATLIIGKMTPGSLAANAAFAEAVAYTIVAVILFAISLIPVVGQIIAGVIAAIDGLIAVACAIGSAIAGEDVSQRPGGWACGGISGLAAELIKGFIYNAIVMVDISDPDRLVFDAFDISLSDPDLGLSAGNAVRYRVSLTNTIERKKVLPPTAEMIENWKKGDLIPVDWKSLSYAWQFNDRNAKKTVFDYRWQTEEDDIGGLDFGSMRDDWQSTGEARMFYMQADPASPPIPLGEAGLNQRPTLYLSEGYVLPVQECWIVVEPSPHCATPATARIPYVCAIPVCKVRHQSNTSHLDLGDRFIMDIFPPTLDEFYQPAAKSGGYSPAWTQTPTAASGGVSRFPVQLDFDGDTLLVPAKGGADPDDSRWDTDGDGLNDAFEYQNGSDPTLYDTDRDGLNDTEELRLGTDPRRQDSDGDGLTDGEELHGWEIVYAFDEDGEQLRTFVTSDPLVIDADDDGLSDFKEKVYGFSPNCPSDSIVLAMASAAREGDAPRLLLRFDEPAGSETFADASGYGKTAICERGDEWCPTATAGRYVTGRYFDGRDVLHVSHSELNALRNDLTIAAWIKPDDPFDWEVNLIATARTESDNGFRLYYSENNLFFETYGVHTYSLPDAGLQAGQWSHVAVVMGADNAVTFYVDGIARGTEAFSAPANPDPDDDLLIGGATYPGEQEPYHAFQGDLDEVAFFDRALVPGEVAALVEARYNPNDLIVQPGATVACTATLTNKLYDRYAQGLHSVASVQASALVGALPPETFVLQPIEVSTLEGEVQVAEAGATTSSGPFTLTQQVNAQINDWREASNFAELWLPLNETDDGTSMTFADQSGSVPPRDAVCESATCPTPHVGGYFDYAVGFNGVESLTLPSTRKLGFERGSFTLSAWVKGYDFSGGRLRTIMGTDPARSPSISFLMHGRSPAMRFDNQLLTAGAPLNPQAWYHLVFRYDAHLGEQSIYVNGERRGAQMGVTPFTGSGAVYLGRAGSGLGFAGAIDDVRTFQRALSLDEIRALYNRPVMRLSFEDDDFQATRRAFDASGFGNTAGCSGANCPDKATGIYGEQAAQFSGEDYLTVSDDPSVDLGEGQFTIAAWLWRDHLSDDWDEPQGILGRYTGVDDTGVSTSGNERYSYPSLFNVDGKVRFGYGTGDVWVTRTTSDTVLTEESWNHVVLSFGPAYRLDGTFEQYRAVLYVNNVVRADWGMGEAPPVAIASDFFVGRASDKAEIYVDRFKVLRQADESPHCEIRMSWDDEEIDEWGGLDPDEERDVHFSAVFRNEGTLRAWEDDDGAESGHNYSDDPLCDIELNNCEGQGRTFTTHDPADPRITLDWEGDDKDSSEGLNHEDRTRIEIYLGAPGKPAFTNPSIPFHGRMDELTLYKRPLSTAEVQELYFSASMAMRLPFDDPPGSKTFRDTVDVSLQGGAYCSGSTCPTAGINGRENQAALFDGVDDVVYTDLLLDQSAEAGGATLAAWARPASASPGVHDVIRSSQQGWSLVRAGDVWRVYQPGAGPLTSVSAPVDVGQWQHLVAVFDPHAGVTLYKNGVAVASTAVLLNSDAKTALSVGASFDGALDDVRVFNRPLAPADVETLYYHAPVFQLHLDEPHGGTPPFRDAAGGVEATCAHQCPASGLGGQVGLAAGFNLNADKLTDDLVFARTPALQSRAFTIGAWVQPTSVEGGRLIHNGFQSFLSLSDALFPTVGVYYGNYSAQELRSTTPVALNQWSHVMGTYDGADLRIYVNGYLQGELATTFDAITDTDKLRIGDQDFVGRLDEVVIYHRALAPDEIRDMFLYQGKLVEAHSATQIMVDNEPPVSKLRSYNVVWPYAGPEGVALHVEAHDETSSVSLLELGVDGAYTAALPCADAVGDASWCPFFDPRDKEGTYQLTTRATDITGHRETPEATYALHVDATAPDISRTLTSGELVAAIRHPTLMGHWIAHLGGTLVDPALTSGVPGSGVDPDAVFVSLHGSEGDPLGVERQLATVVSDTWSIDYVFNGARPTGRYTVTVAASDRMGNGASAAIATRLHMDAAAPAADLDLRDGVAVDQPFSGLVSELPLPQETLLALRFEEQAGATTFYDSSGGQRHGACIAAVCPTAGVVGISGRAARFDGLYHLVSLSPRAASGLHTFDTGVSMAAWLNLSTLEGQQPIGASGRASSPDDGFAFRLDGRDLVFETLGVHTYRLADAGLATGRWTHVAAVMDASYDVTFYVDGVARGTVSYAQPGQADMDDRFFIGSDGSGTGFNGALDEVLVVGRALEADEVRQLAQTRALGVASVEAAFRPVLPGSPFDHWAQPASLVMQLPLDDETNASEVGTLTLMDLAGEGATASCVGGACPEINEPGRVGSAVRFDGREDTLALNDFGVFTTTTVAAWVRRDEATGARQTVLAYKERADCGFVLALDGVDAHPYALFNVGGSWVKVEDAAAIPAATWVHVTASYDGTTARLYRDGQLAGETAAPGGLAQCSAGSAIGSNPTGTGDFFAGALDEMRIYRRALSGAEIEALYLGHDPLLALPFDFGQGWATDGAGVADDSDWRHAVNLRTGDGLNKVVAGQVGPYALALDGSDDYVAVAAAPSLALDHSAPAFTQAAWVYVEPQDNELYPIISSAAYDAPAVQYPFVQVIERDRLVVGFGDGTTLHSFTTEPLLTPGAWHHIAGAFDGQTYTVYVDGEPRVSTDHFAGLHPASAHRFDVGRGARAEALGCATLEVVALTGVTWEQQWRVRYQGAVVYDSPVYPTAGRAYDLSLDDAFCGAVSFELEARAWDPSLGWGWHTLGVFDLTPAPGERTHSFSAGGRTGALTWRTTTPRSNLRYFRGKLDAVYLYPYALGPLDVQRLYTGRWLPADLAAQGGNVDVTSWHADAPEGLEGAYAVDTRGWDVAGHADTTGLSQGLWNGELDTLAPRVAITRTVAGDRYHYETVAEDYNLVRNGFSSPCGAGIGEAEPFSAAWYRTVAGPAAPGEERFYRLAAVCDTPASGLFEVGAWREQPWITGGAVVVTGTGGTMAYVPAGRLWQVDVSDPARPRLDDIYPAVQHAQGVALDDAHAYVAEGVYGLSVLSLADPAAPAAGYDTPGEAMDVAAAGDYVVVADGSGGLRVVDVRDPANPAEVGAVATEGDALGVAVSAMPTTTLMRSAGGALSAPLPIEPIAGVTGPDEVSSLQTAISEPALPTVELSPEAWASVREQIEELDYALTWDEEREAFVSRNQANAWLTTLSDVGITVAPSDAAWSWQLALTGYGTGDQMQAVSPLATPVQDGHRVAFQRDQGVTDWYTHDARGVEQGFTLAHPPQAGRNTAIHVRMALTTTLTPVVTTDGQAVLFRHAGGQIMLRYADLHAFDATGRTLPAQLALDGARAIVLTVDTTDAVYPITIDPLLTRSLKQLTAFDGETGAQFGYAIAVSGDTLAVGSPWITGTVAQAGAVYLFQRHADGPEQWGLVKKISASNGAMGDRFGSAVALYYDELAVGAPYATVGGNVEQGALYLFRRNQGGPDAWGQVKLITATTGTSGDHFGTALAMDSDRIAVGAPQADNGALVDTGAAYVFARNAGGTDTWGAVDVITAPGGLTGDGFGASVAMDGLMLVAGAPQANATRGAAYIVYAQDQGGVEAWEPVTVLTATDGVAGDQFGAAVDVLSDRVVVGAPLAAIDAQAEQGAAYLFDRTVGGMDVWGLRTKVTTPSGVAGDNFGTAVALDGDALLVGAPDGAGGQGAAYIFIKNRGGAGAWGLARVLAAPLAQAGAAFGQALAFDGTAVVVGAPSHDLAAADDGVVTLFSRTGDTWLEQIQLDSGDATYAAHALALHDDILVVGAPSAVGGGNTFYPEGEVYIFQRDLGGVDPWTLRKTLQLDLSAHQPNIARFGATVALAGDTLIVGAPTLSISHPAGFPLASKEGVAVLFGRHKGGADNWGQITSYMHTDYRGDNGSEMGQTIVAGDTWFAIGASAYDQTITDTGRVRIYVRDVSNPNGWRYDGDVNVPPTAYARLGSSLATNGELLAVGEGSSKVYLIDPASGAYGPVKTLTISAISEIELAFAGDTLVVGSTRIRSITSPPTYESTFSVFDRNTGGADNWGFVTDLPPVSSRGPRLIVAQPDLIALNTPTDDSVTNAPTDEITFYARNEGGTDTWGALPPLNLGPDFINVGGLALSDDHLVIYEWESFSPTSTVHIYQLAARPVGHTDIYTTDESLPLLVVAPGVLTNDDPTEGMTLTVAVDIPPAHGALTLDVTGAFTYTPAPYYYGADAFTYRANDGVLDSLPTTVTLIINPVNDAPVAVADVYTPTEDVLFTIGVPGVLDNDQDVEHDPLTATLVTTPTHGVLAFVDDGSFQYMPDADYNGADAFTYYAGDGDLDSNVVTVTLNVAAVNDAPVAAGDAYTTAEDVVLNVAAPGVLANDDDVDGDVLQATVVQSPTVGSLTLAGNGALLYEPPLNAYGVVTFTYRVSDGGLSATATVTLTLTAVNDPPDAQADAYTTNLNTPLTVVAPGLLGNDSDPEGAGLTATLATAPGHGDATVALDGALTYTPTVGYHGVDTFAYRVSDGSLSATATVTLMVNGPPSAGDVAIFTQEEISTTLRLIPDHTSDPEGDTLVVSAVGAPLSGTATISGTTGVTYTPAPNFSGVDTFIYTVVDPGGLTATGRITVTVGGINDAPVAVDDAVTTPEDQPVTVAVMDNDSDPDGQTPQLLSVGAPVQGDAEMVGTSVVYTPPADFYGTDGFTYLIGDGVLTATGRVTVTVTSVNDAPTLDALADVALEPNAAEQRIGLRGIGTGAPNEAQPLSIQAVSTNPALIPHPAVAYDGSATTGELRFTPTAGLTGTATVSVTVSDGLSQTIRAFRVTVWDATGPFAYVAAGEAGLLIIDLSRPESPRRIAQVATSDAARDVTLAGDTVYVAAGAAGLLVVDVSTPVAPAVLAPAVTDGFAGDAGVIGDQVFVTDGYAGVAQVDVGDPTAPFLVSASDTPGYASQLMAMGHALYVSDGTGGLRIFDTTLPPGQATACDRAGNCTTAAATVVHAMTPMASRQANLEAGVRILSAPPLLVETGAVTVTGKAFTALSSLRALTLTVDHQTVYTTMWASGAVSATAWHAPWDSSGLTDGPHALRATAVAWDGALVTETVTVTLDTQAPVLALATTVLTHAHYQAPGALVVAGQAIDAGGVVGVDLLVGQNVYAATLEGQAWRAPWILRGDTLPDGETFTVTVQATDVAGHVAQITRTLLVDVTPPAAPSLTLRHGDARLSAGMTVREVSPTLALTWTATHDGSGLDGYDVAWLALADGVQTVVTDTPGLTRQAAYTAPEAAKVSVRLGARDVHGQTRWESAGPIYVDGPRTPDYVTLRDVDGIYRGWMASGCALLGVDRRVMRDELDTGTLNAEQRFYGTWDGEGLRLAWTGANWDTDGDLFVYVDTGPGGAVTAFDPYGVTTTTVYLPGVTPAGTAGAPTSTVGAMAADALIWVRDAATALLLRWDAGADAWVIQGPLSGAGYHYDAEVDGGQTDLYVPFAQLGLASGGSLDLVAFATDKGALDLWATMPNANPLSSDQVTELAPPDGDGVRFALVQRYHWDHAGAGVCPNGSDGSSLAYRDTEVQTELSASPEGVAYSLVESDFTWLWTYLAGDRSADVTSYFDRMSTEHPRVGSHQAITYTLRYRNAGAEPATGLYADVTAHYALRLMPGGSDRRILLGDLDPGDVRSISFQAMVDLARSPEPWAAVTVAIYDGTHPAGGPPLERLWLDHQVDRAPPAFVGITEPAYVLGARVNRIQGYVYDLSPVPGGVLRLEDGTVVLCSDPTPSDGAWACELDTTTYDNGDVLTGRVEVVDLFGQRSAPSAARQWVVDTAPPTVTLTQPSGGGATLVAESAQFAGMLYDNVGLASAELCQVDEAGQDVCAPAPVRLSGIADVQVVADTPASPVSIAGAACGAGSSGIVRSLTVTESFTLGGVSVGFSAEHSLRDDLEVTLVAPSGKAVTLLTDDGLSGTAFRNYDVWLDDTAVGSYAPRYDDVVKGTFARQARPATPLSSLIGEEAAGTWQLVICDRDPAANAGTYRAGQLYLSPEPAHLVARTGTWDYTYHPGSDLDYVAQELRVVGVDLAGNRTTDPLTLSLMVDNVAPVVTMTQVVTSALLVEDLTVLTGEVYDGSFAGQADATGVQWQVVVIGPGGTTTSAGTRDGARWSYSLRPPAPGTYHIAVSVYDQAGNVTTVGPYVVEVRPWSQVFMPVIANNFVPAPDLVVQQVVAGPQGVQVVVANRGSVAVTDGFWVDLYVNPPSEPLEVNQTWSTLGTQGAAWGVTRSLDAGAALTLTVGGAYYSAAYSNLAWPLAVGTPIYAQVDSAGDPGYGGVREDHEVLRLGYNNIRSAEVGSTH